jgi:Kef-type K+ transport system membrane component KefB
VSVGDLALIGLCGLVGPLLAANSRVLMPAVVGEILAGVALGRTGFRVLDISDPTLVLLSEVGFALLMFHVGMRVPLRNAGLRGALSRGAAAAVTGALVAVPAGLLAAAVASGPARVYAVVLASSSAALVLPILEERGVTGASALVVMAQVTVADIAAMLALTFVLRPHQALRAAVGTLLVALCVIALLLIARALRDADWVKRLRHESKRRGWALDLRVVLVILFGLTWVAGHSGSSGLIAGFGAGLMVAAIGGPKRLDTQVLGIGEGFFVPLFFVVLGAKLDLRALFSKPSLLALTGALLLLSVVVHVTAARLTGQRAAAGLVTTAQLGVPAAAVAIGLPAHVVTPGQATALIAAALGTIALTSLGAARMGRPPGEA